MEKQKKLKKEKLELNKLVWKIADFIEQEKGIDKLFGDEWTQTKLVTHCQWLVNNE